jgi:hypothetical protein
MLGVSYLIRSAKTEFRAAVWPGRRLEKSRAFGVPERFNGAPVAADVFSSDHEMFQCCIYICF